jgi:hypothetical protein
MRKVYPARKPFSQHLKGSRLIPLAVILIALAWAAWGWHNLLAEQSLIRHARQVQGTVLSSGLQSSPSLNRTGSPSHRPFVRYAYRIDGELLENDRVTPAGLAGDFDWANKLVIGYRTNDPVTVYVTSDGPYDTFLVPQFPFRPYLPILGAAAVVVLATTWLGWVIWPDGRWRGFILSLAVWSVSELLIFGHFCAVAPPPRDSAITNAVIAYVIFGVASCSYEVISRTQRLRRPNAL